MNVLTVGLYRSFVFRSVLFFGWQYVFWRNISGVRRRRQRIFLAVFMCWKYGVSAVAADVVGGDVVDVVVVVGTRSSKSRRHYPRQKRTSTDIHAKALFCICTSLNISFLFSFSLVYHEQTT